MKKLIHGVGINDAGYNISISTRLPNGRRQEQRCPYYKRWVNMLTRCYSKAEQARNPCYIGCVVCPEWLTFSNFKRWMEQQDWKGKELDKDKHGDGKLYSPTTCEFLTYQEHNKLQGKHHAPFITESTNTS